MREIGLNHNELAVLADEITGQGGSFSFKACGSSMYPFIKNGDIITIQSVNPNALCIGDIAFYKSDIERFTAHRIIKKKFRNNMLTLLMRGDSMRYSDGWISSDQVLGKVVNILRGEKVIKLNKSYIKIFAFLWHKMHPIGPISLNLICDGRKTLSWILRYLQSLKMYRLIAKKLAYKRIAFQIADANDAYRLTKFYGYHKIPEIEDPVGLVKSELLDPENLSYTIIASISGEIVGATVLVKFQDIEEVYPDWWLFGMTVRIRYRGSGIGEGIMRMVIEKASEQGALRLNLLVFEKNKAAVNLYRKTGFRQISIPQLDKQLEEEAQKEKRRRIIMSRTL